jgi:hypothetical protein
MADNADTILPLGALEKKQKCGRKGQSYDE